MNEKLLILAALSGCVGETEIATETQRQTATVETSVISCYELEDRNSICHYGNTRFESKDLGLSSCTKTRSGLSCVALAIDSPNLPPDFWAIGTSNGGVWKNPNLSCVDATLHCDGVGPMHCWCGSAATGGVTYGPVITIKPKG